MREANDIQRTGEWLQDRCGCLTASSAAKAIKKTAKGSYYASRKDELMRIIAERMTGSVQGIPVNTAMQWGIDTEPRAKEEYEIETGRIIQDVGFVPHPSIAWFGASPDGLVGTDGLIEIKCPNTVTHIERCLTREIPIEYQIQMQIQLLCTGRKWVDFVDYDPRLQPRYESKRLLIIRYEPTEDELQETLGECIKFLNEVDKKLSSLS